MKYQGDPRIIKSRFESKCAKCGEIIPKDINIIYYPNGKKAYHQDCGWDDYQASIAAMNAEDNEYTQY